jgi:tetratricopeptide (TPR) repeat protein
MSCSDSFLELNNPAALTYDKFYQTEADFQNALDGCYFRLKNLPPYLLTFNEITSDNTYIHRDNATYQQHQYDNLIVSANSVPVQNFWRDSYQTIAYANIIISRISNSKIPEATQKVFISEAKFIRALCYFNMARVYGGVPLYDTEIIDFNTVYDVKRSSVDEIYEFVIQNLIDSQNIDNERSAEQNAIAKGKATSAAVKALLGKVYLFKHDYDNAIKMFTDVINNSGYKLLSNSADLYNPDTPINDEVIFAINYERVDGQNCTFAFNFLPKYSRGILPNITGSDNGDGLYNLEDAIVAGYDKNDKRFTLIDSLETQSGEDVIMFYYTKKYLDVATPVSPYNSASDFIFLRYADVLLMMADALNLSGKTNEAYQYINDVRYRAGLSNLQIGLSKEQMNDALAIERQKEFIGEADRWFDLSFRGFDYLKKTLNDFYPKSHTPSAIVKDHMNLFPIPADQVNLKPEVLEQNPGY